jgi:hypothetical protein
MNYLYGIAFLIGGLLGALPDTEQAKSDAAVAVAYAAIAKPKPAPQPAPVPVTPDKPKPDETLACECQDGCNCGETCDCVGCKLDGSCCDCGKPAEWSAFIPTGKNLGEYRKVRGSKVLEVRKYIYLRTQTCHGTHCTFSWKWVPAK